MLDSFNSGKSISSIDSCIVDNEIIKEKDYSLWVYDFFEIYPESPFPVDYLGNYIEERIEGKNNPWESEEDPLILGVSNRIGVFDNDTSENKQKYKRVYTGDLVYNPHRINVGSLGIVPDEFDKGYTSGIYVVFKSTNKTVPPEFILKLLKSKQYLKVVGAYDTKYGAVRANLTYEMLCKIKIPILSNEKLKTFLKGQKELNKIKYNYAEQEGKLNNFISDITSEYKVKKTKVN